MQVQQPWIRYRQDLRVKPQVIQIANELGTDRVRVVGALMIAWSYVSNHAERPGDGNAYLPEAVIGVIEAEAETPGLIAAMQAVLWADVRDGALVIPKWDEHNDEKPKGSAASTSKQAEAQRRYRERRKAAQSTGDNALDNAHHNGRDNALDNALHNALDNEPPPDKIREDTPPPPHHNDAITRDDHSSSPASSTSHGAGGAEAYRDLLKRMGVGSRKIAELSRNAGPSAGLTAVCHLHHLQTAEGVRDPVAALVRRLEQGDEIPQASDRGICDALAWASKRGIVQHYHDLVANTIWAVPPPESIPIRTVEADRGIGVGYGQPQDGVLWTARALRRGEVAVG